MSDSLDAEVIDCIYLHETDDAVKIKVIHGKITGKVNHRELWVPKSVTKFEQQFTKALKPGQVIELEVAEWFAEKEGLI